MKTLLLKSPGDIFALVSPLKLPLLLHKPKFFKKTLTDDIFRTILLRVDVLL